MSKLGNYLGISRKANYLIIGNDNIKYYSKKMYLIILSPDCSENLRKNAKFKAEQYGIDCIEYNDSISKYIGIENCKIVALKNKGLSEAILKCNDEYIKL